MFGRRRQLAQTFRVSPDALWRAMPASLPSVTQQATWYEQARRVEWSIDTTGWAYPQNLSAWVEPAADGTSVLKFTGATRYRASIGDQGRRRHAFETLVAALTEAVDHPLTTPVEQHTDDEFRWWNGHEWTFDPPPPPPPPPPPSPPPA